MFAKEIVRGVAGERWFAYKHFVEHASERIDIAARIQPLAPDLFWGHVGAGPLHFALAAEEFAQARFGLLGDSEVDEFYQAIAVDQYVIRLDIAMHVALAVEVIEGFADLLDDGGEHESDRFWALSHRLFQVDFAKELEDDKRSIGVGYILNQLDDVFVVEVTRDFKFVFEEGDFLFVAPLFGAKHFEGVMVAIVFDSFPDLASASEADQAGQSVRPQEVSNFNHENPVFCPGMAPPSPALPWSGKRKTFALKHSLGALPCPATGFGKVSQAGPTISKNPLGAKV